MTERTVINDILANLPDNRRLFRINAGMGFVGNVIRQHGNILILQDFRVLHAAPKGYPDLSGWTSIEITPDMVGKKLAVFTGVEVKTTGRLTREQKLFKKIIEKHGGMFEVVESTRK